MKCKKKISKILIIAMIFMSISSVGIINAEAAGNYTDEDFNFYTHVAGAGRFTGMRGKWDYTSSYVYNTNSDYALKVNVWGGSSTGVHQDVSLEPYKQVNVGVASYLKNLVKEEGYNYCALQLLQTGQGWRIIGKWSPDSI